MFTLFWLAVVWLSAFASAKLTVCPRGGTDCTEEQNVCSDVGGLCCVYSKPVEGSVRCYCQAGYGGPKCDKPINDPDFFESGQDYLQERLDLSQNTRRAKNVILFIGDGMSLTTVATSRVYKAQQEDSKNLGEENSLNFERFPVLGLSKTYNVNHQISGSAATATQMYTGQKVNYGTLGMNKNVVRYDCEAAPGNQLDNIFDWAQAAGKRTGIVTNTRMTHATPAAAYAHSAARDWESDLKFNEFDAINAEKYGCEDIASQLVSDQTAQNMNVMLGGGRRAFYPMNQTDPLVDSAGQRKDNRSLTEEWLAMRGPRASYVYTKDQLNAIDSIETEYLLGLFSYSHMDYNYKNKENGYPQPTLTEMTEKALEIVQQGDKGFVVMIEGGRIDHGHHGGYARRAMDETIEMEKAIQKAMDMMKAKEELDDTLIIVTADHSHVYYWGGYTSRGNDVLGFVDTIDIEPALDGMNRTALGYGDGPGGPPAPDYKRLDMDESDLDGFSFKQQAAVLTGDESHGGDDVGIYAKGPWAHLLDGVVEQNFIAHVISYAACIGESAKEGNACPSA